MNNFNWGQSNKIDLNNYYNKSEINDKVDTIETKFNNYYTKNEIDNKVNDINDKFNDINDKFNEYYKNNEIIDSNTNIVEMGNNKVMVIFQADIRNHKNSGEDLYSALPLEVQNLTNVDQIEYLEYNFVQEYYGKNKIFTNYIGNIAASVYANRIYLKNENDLPYYIEYIRVKLIYTKL